MINVHKYKILLFTVSLTGMILTGCNNESDPTASNITTAKVEGQVIDKEGHSSTSPEKGVENAVVTLVQIQANGSAKTVSKNSVQTDANGKFTLETELNGVSGLIVAAVKGTESWKAVISSEIKHGLTVYSQPLNDETTAEAEIYEEAKTENYDVYYADISTYIGAEAAFELKGNSQKAKNAAEALKLESEARAKAYASSFVGLSTSKLQAIINAREQAQATLERDLFYAQNSAAVNAAFESYFNSVIEAYANAGINTETYIKILEISNRALVNKAAGINSSVKFHLQKRAALIRAKAIQQIMQTQFIAAGASATILSAIASASAQFTISLNEASNSNQIINAFDNYHSIVISNLTSAMGVYGSVLAAIEIDIAGYKTNLKSAVGTNLSVDAILAAYIDFYQKVKTECQTKLAQAGTEKINACTEILILASVQF